MKHITEYLQKSETEYLWQLCAQCKNIQDLKLEEPLLSELHALAKQNTTNKIFLIALPLIWAIDLSSIPVDIAWATIDLADLDQTTKWLVFGIAITLTICAAIYIYQISTKKIEDNQRLAVLKKHIFEEVKSRISVNTKADEIKAINTFTMDQHNLKESIIAGISCAVILFTTFYWGASDILQLLGFENAANFMTDSPCMSIAITFIVLLSFYLGYQYFLGPNNNPIVSEQNPRQVLKESSLTLANLEEPPLTNNNKTIPATMYDYHGRPKLEKSEDLLKQYYKNSEDGLVVPGGDGYLQDDSKYRGLHTQGSFANCRLSNSGHDKEEIVTDRSSLLLGYES